MKSFFIKLYLSLLILKGINPIFNVHIIPHVYLNPGLIYTLDENYELNISSVFNHMLGLLTTQNNRTFVIREIIYFIKWYKTEITPESKTKLKNLINLNIIEFVLGGNIMNDLYLSTYQDILEQIRYIMKFLIEEFNYTIKPAFYLNSFGVSSGYIHLLTKLDFNFLILEKIPYDISNKIIVENKTEFFWKGFNQKNGNKKILTHIFPILNGTNKNYNFIISDNINDNNVEKYANEFMKLIKNSKQGVSHNNFMFLFGQEFQFGINKDLNFRNIEKIKKYIESKNWAYFKNEDYYIDDKINIFYSLPQNYYNSVYDNYKNNFSTIINKDFLPHDEKKEGDWNEFFSSNYFFKGLIRKSSKIFYDIENFFTQVNES